MGVRACVRVRVCKHACALHIEMCTGRAKKCICKGMHLFTRLCVCTHVCPCPIQPPSPLTDATLSLTALPARMMMGTPAQRSLLMNMRTAA